VVWMAVCLPLMVMAVALAVVPLFVAMKMEQRAERDEMASGATPVRGSELVGWQPPVLMASELYEVASASAGDAAEAT
jgi:hypothetical protein